MSWFLHDEFIDLQQSRHVVIYRNRDSGAEHHLIYFFAVDTSLDFEQRKAEELAALNAHHRQSLAYAELHKHVRKAAK